MVNRNCLKIGILVEYLSYVGGGERVYCLWANMFADKLGYDVYIASFEDYNRPFYYLSPKVKVDSLRLRKSFFYRRPFARRLSMVVNFFSDRKRIKSYLREHDFDIVLGIATNVNLLLSTISVSSVKVATEHTEYYAPNFFLRYLRSFLYKRMNAVTVLNFEDEKKFMKINSETYVMLNPVEFPSRMSANDLNNKKMISIGSLSPQKNQKEMLDIMKLVHAVYPDWILEIYGEGPLHDALVDYAERIGVSSYVKFCGVTNDVYSKLCTASIFLLTSIREGFGLVLVEAMNSGLPCVSFDALGPKMLIEDGKNGYLVSKGDISLFSEKVCLLISDIELRRKMGEDAKKVSSKYSIDNVSTDWEKFFNKILKKN